MKAGVEALMRLPGVWRGGELEHVVHTTVPTGHAALDRELPGGGWPMGTLSEVLHDGTGIGEVRFLAGAIARASANDRLVAWINAPHLPYAPALAQAGVALERCLVVRPRDSEDALWTAEQVLKSGACGAALLWLGGVKNLYAWLRRLQMAAESGHAMAVFFRNTADEILSTPAHLRVAVSWQHGNLQVRIPKRRGPPLTRPIAIDAGAGVGPGARTRPEAASVPLPFAPASRVVSITVAS